MILNIQKIEILHIHSLIPKDQKKNIICIKYKTSEKRHKCQMSMLFREMVCSHPQKKKSGFSKQALERADVIC